MFSLYRMVAAVTLTTASVAALSPNPFGGSLGIAPGAIWRNQMQASAEPLAKTSSAAEDVSTAAAYTVGTFDCPISHFPEDPKYAPHVNGTFKLRYWVEASSYVPGGPVIVLDSGETSGTGRLPFLTQGIVKILANATGGVGVVLEMRYYGASTVTANLTTDNMRFLDTAQSLADAKLFAENIVFPGLEQYDLTAPNTPWIYYGGSYAGAKAAYIKVAYPDTFYGAIGSSGVVEAIVDYWEYYEPIIENANQTCINKFEAAITAFDGVLATNDTDSIESLKASFGLAGLTYTEDFASALTWPIDWQSRNWDPKVDSSDWDSFCASLVASDAEPLFGSTALGALASLTSDFANSACGGLTADQCFGNQDPSVWQVYGLSQTWRLWMWQYCTEEGYIQHGPPEGQRAITSRFYKLEYWLNICKVAFPDGAYRKIPDVPDVSIPNAYGGYAIASDRLAFIDGEADPWLPATPHSKHAPERKDSTLRPFYLIPDAVHHWDENSLPGGLSNPALPEEIRKVQQYMVDFVKAWLADFNTTQKA